jgi:hypothetical protein
MKYNMHRSITYLRLIIASVFILSLASCEKEVHINLGTTPPKVVVQGQIETGLVPLVALTSTVSFFANVDLGTLQNSFLHDAHVTVADGTNTITLKEYSVDTGTNYKFYFYSVDSSNIMIGQVGKTYTLSVTYSGTTYTAIAKIPNPKGIDSMWFDVPEFSGTKTPPTARQLFVNYTDPDTTGDCVRYFTKRNDQEYYPSGIFSDEVVNGKTITKIGLVGGYQSSSEPQNRDSLIYFFPGDTVTLKWCSIDKGVYNFWNSLEFAQNAVGNPFSSPINPVSNVSNGGLGVWSAYGSKFTTLVVPN